MGKTRTVKPYRALGEGYSTQRHHHPGFQEWKAWLDEFASKMRPSQP